MRDKSAAKSKSHNLMDKLSATKAEKEELGCRLATEKEDADKACAEA
jgi:chromosome segregation ATPase